MSFIAKIVLVCFFIFALDRLGLWLESKGWLYYRKRKAQGGFVGNALLELNSVFQPSARHVLELKQNTVQYKRNEEDAPGAQ